MKTERKLALALKDMMATIPLEEISVTALSQKCNVSRKTFYYYFHDTFDLLTLVFLNEQIDNINFVNNIKELVAVLYHYYDNNTGFLEACLNSAGKELVFEFFYNNCYQAIIKIFSNLVVDGKSNSKEIKNFARFESSAIAYSTIYYLSNFKVKSLGGLMAMFSFMENENIIKELKKNQ